MYKVIEDNGGKCLGFFDDVTIYVHGNVKENTEKLSKLLAVGTEMGEGPLYGR
jgi:hypothetical protein